MTAESFGSGSILASFFDGSSRLIDDQRGVAGLVIATLLFGAALLWFKKGSGANVDAGKVGDDNDESWLGAAAKSSDAASCDASEKASPASGGDGKLRNVFSVKQKPIVHGGSSRKQASSDRPFESSYYFAHNKHSTGGGYKDGLRAEDYVMNGPKLLSKGGVRVEDEPKDSEDAGNGQECTQTDQTNAQEKPKRKLTSSTPITKYMWDDDGNSNVAKIHIDSLPVSSTKTISWESAGISRDQVDVRLMGENDGLYIGVTHEGKRYHLHVPKMYGEAESVKSIVKKHKLLVKITKKKVPKRHSRRHKSADEGAWTAATKALGKLVGGGGEVEEEYISVAWPRLSASSTGGLGGGTADIDEKLFKEMDGTMGGGEDYGIQF